MSDDAHPTPPDTPSIRPVDVMDRLRRDGRWLEARRLKKDLVKEGKDSGMDGDQANVWAYTELDRMYPPQPEPELVPKNKKRDEPEHDGDVTESKDVAGGEQAKVLAGAGEKGKGVGKIPENWPKLPGNASLAAEIAWVQAERLRVVDETSGTAKVDLALASVPAPSMSALSWLETSVRSYAKYVDVCARVMATQVDEQQHVQRERMAIEEIRALLREMRKA